MSLLGSPQPFRSPLSAVNPNRRGSLASALVGFLSSAKKPRPDNQNSINGVQTESGPVAGASGRSSLSGAKLSPGCAYSLSHVSGTYDGDLHLPKYSQSEMDAAAEESVATIAELKDVILFLEKEKSSQGVCESDSAVLASLQRSLEEERARVAALTEKMSETVLMRMQSKALAHRLLVLEEELAEKDALSEKMVASIMADVASKQRALEAVHEKTLAAAYEEAKKEVLASHDCAYVCTRNVRSDSVCMQVRLKAQLQFESGNAKFAELKRDYRELRAKYDERATEVAALTARCEELEARNDSATLLCQARENEIEELRVQTETLRRDKTALIGASVSSASTVQAMQASVDRAKEELQVERKNAMVAKVTASELEGQLRSMRGETDGQLAAIATLTASRSATESQLEAARVEVAELTARCANLREMNKEMLAMLEAGGD